MAMKYMCIPISDKIYPIFFPFQGPPKYTRIGILYENIPSGNNDPHINTEK
jgi:hypothetical protein